MSQHADTKHFIPTDQIRSIPKVLTHIHGLDQILEGGLPEGRITAVVGGPGSGKTLIGLEFAYRSALAGEPCLLVSFEERASELRRNALAIGWDLKPLEDAGKLFLIDSRPGPDVVRTGNYNLSGLLAILNGKAEAVGARRLVIDSMDVILRIFEDSTLQQDQLYQLTDWLNKKAISAILTARMISDTNKFSSHRFLEFAADCLIKMESRVEGQITTRRLRVVKYRGSSYGSNQYPCIISQGGLFLLPISTMGLNQSALREPISSGRPEIDQVLGGGYRRASSILVTGGAGTGKTTLLSTFVEAACRGGEKVLFINFEESAEAMMSAMLSINIDLGPFFRDGTLQMITAMPESMGAEEHFFRAFKAIEQFSPDHIVVDAISATLRIGKPQAAFEYVMRLISTCKERGITSLMSNQGTSRAINMEQISNMGISSLVDTVLLLRYVDKYTEIGRLLLVVKSRGMAHSNQYNEFRITDHGISLLGPFEGDDHPGLNPKQSKRDPATHPPSWESR